MATASALLLGRGPGSDWVRANPPSAFPDEDEALIHPAPPALSRPQKRAPGPRFVEPCRLEASQRAALLTALEAEGLGDEDSRQIFLAALEYDLAGCRRLLAEQKLPPPASPEAVLITPSPPIAVEAAAITPPSSATPASALADLADLAGNLAQALAELIPAQRETLQWLLEASDCLGRGYGDSYLDTLRLELLHLQAAFHFPAAGLNPQAASVPSTGTGLETQTATANSSAPGPENQAMPANPSASGLESQATPASFSSPDLKPQAPTMTTALIPPPIPVEVQKFLRRAADAYNDCFEGEPSLAANTPFPRILQVLDDITGLTLPVDETTLSEILAIGC